MAELIHNYLKGRMNKDLDERLVPNGEYRDALNIEISTSEDSNTGAVQTLKGNVEVTGLDAALDTIGFYNSIQYLDQSPSATVVGSIAVESENKVLSFVSLASDFEDGATYTINGVDYVQKTGIKSDAILEWNSYVDQEGGNTYALVVDVFESRIVPPGAQANIGVIEAVGSNNIASVDLYYANQPLSLDKYPAGVRPGMKVELIGPDGQNAYLLGDDVRVEKVISSSLAGNIKIFTTPPSNGQLMTQNLVDEGYVYRFTAPRILNFNTGSQESESNVSGTPTSPTPKDTMITAINYVDGILFYTDNRNEPKRIHLKDFYNAITGNFHSFANIKHHSPFCYATGKLNFFKEEHITTIRKSPRLAPTAIGQDLTRPPGGAIVPANGALSTLNYGPFTTAVTGSSFNLAQAGGGTTPLSNLNPPGTTLNIHIPPGNNLDNCPNWQVGDTLIFTGSVSGAIWTGVIMQDVTTDASLDHGDFIIQIEDYDISYTVFDAAVDEDGLSTVPSENFIATLSDKNNYLYNKDFVSFAVRYKYKNGEYSSISPYSNTVFLPSVYSYNSLEGDNLGMQNAVRSIIVSNFVTPEVPSDVDYIQILFKNNNSLNLNIIKSIKRDSDEWNADTPGDPNVTGKIFFESEVFGATVETDQLERPYDTVPRSAKAQEFIASRLLYGNYKEGYDLVDSAASEVILDCTTGVTSYNKSNLISYTGSQLTVGGGAISTVQLSPEKVHNNGRDNFQKGTWSTFNYIYDSYADAFNAANIGTGVPNLIPGVGQDFWESSGDDIFTPTYGGLFKKSSFLSPVQIEVFNYINSTAVFDDIIDSEVEYKASYTNAQLVTLANYKNNAFSLGSQDGGNAITMEITGEGIDTRSFTGRLFSNSPTAEYVSSIPYNYTADDGTTQTATEWHWSFNFGNAAPVVQIGTNIRQNSIVDGIGSIREITKPNFQEINIGSGDIGDPLAAGPNTADVVVDMHYEAMVDEDVEVDVSTTPVFTIEGKHLSIYDTLNLGNSLDGGRRCNKTMIPAKFSSLTVTCTLLLVKTLNNGSEVIENQNSLTFTPPISSSGVTDIALSNVSPLTLNHVSSLLTGEKLRIDIKYDYSVGNLNLPDVTDPISLFDFAVDAVNNCPVGFQNLSTLSGSSPNFGGTPVPHPEFGEHRATYYKVKMASQNSNVEFKTVGIASVPSYTKDARSFPSVKSEREYQIGVVYGDYYGRETPVIYNKDSTVRVNKSKAPLFNNLTITLKNNPPAWADYYKFYIKEFGYEYYNIPLFKAFPLGIDDPNAVSLTPNNLSVTGAFYSGTGEAILAFSKTDRSKIEEGDFLVLKKAHGEGGVVQVNNYLSNQPAVGTLNGAVVDEEARFKVLEIIDTLLSDTPQGGGTTVYSIETVGQLNTVLGASTEDVLGRFFVKIKADAKFDKYIGIAQGTQSQVTYDSDGLRSQSERGAVMPAVFEIEKKKNIDIDLFYEVGSAYPIRLDEQSAKDYINNDFILQVESIPGAAYTAFDIHEINKNLRKKNVRVKSFRGAKSFGSNHVLNINPASSDQGVGLAFVEFEYSATDFHTALDTVSAFPVTTVAQGNVLYGQLFAAATASTPGAKLQLLDRNTGAKVELEVVYSLGTNSNTIAVKPFTHKNAFYPRPVTITLPFYNCISFGNGVESDRILDKFGEDTMYPYGGGGEPQLGFKVSLPNDDYKEVQQTNQIIFSQQYNKAIGGGFNEFIIAQNITKLINYEFGYITKLHARNTDLIALCESKVVKILAQKDAAYDVMGSANFIASNKVLGSVVPFIGNYGCQHAESFAEEEYRIYFADQAKGAVLRLSRDGLTPISEAGMSDWFNDNMAYAQSIIGGYDAKKNAYIITIHKVDNPQDTKQVYTLGFKENVKGWTSFKSYMPESSVSLNNKYYTFKNGLMYLHHPEELSSLHCNFYGTQYEANLTDIFNESSNIVKNYKAVSYEGTQSKVDAFTDVVSGGVTYNDGEFYNDVAKTGWYVESITTDKESGEINEFIEKEGKWYNYIKSNPSSELDLSGLAVEGIDVLSSNAIISSGSLQGQTFNFSFNVTPNPGQQAQWTTNSVPTPLANLPNTATVTISSNSGYGISASDFSSGQLSVTVGGVSQPTINFTNTTLTFVDTTTAGLPSNQVIVTIDLSAGNNAAITADTVITWETAATATQPVVLAEHFVNFLSPQGNFGIGDESFTLASHPWHTSTQQNSADEIVVFSQVDQNNTGQQFLEFTINGNGSFAYVGPPAVNFGADIINNNELGNYTVSTSVASDFQSCSVSITYDPIVTEQVDLDINNIINITTFAMPVVFQFNAGQTPATAFGVPTFATSGIVADLANTAGPFTVAITDPGTPNTIISNPASLVANYTPGQTNFNVLFDVQDSQSTTTQSTGILTATSTLYPNLTADFHFYQPEANVSFLNVGVSWLPVPAAFPNPVQNLNSTTYLADWTGNIFGRLTINYNDTTGSPPNIQQSDVTFVDTGDGTSFVSFNQVSNQGSTSALYDFDLAQNPTTSTRAFEIHVSHPSDPTIPDVILEVVQDGQPLGNFPLNFQLTSSQTPIDGTMVDVGNSLEKDFNQQTFDLYADVNTGSTYSAAQDPILYSNGFYGFSPTDPNRNQVGVIYQFPTGQYYFNNSFPLFNSNDPNDIVPVSTNEFFTTGGEDYDPFSYVDPNTGNQAFSSDYRIPIPLIANGWVAGPFDPADPHLCRIPIDRTVFIQGYNPLVNNITTLPSDSFTLTQKGRPIVFLETTGATWSQANVQGGTTYSFNLRGNFLDQNIITRVKYYTSEADMLANVNGVIATNHSDTWIINDPDIGGSGFGIPIIPSNTSTFSATGTLQFDSALGVERYARVEFAHPDVYSSMADVDATFGSSWNSFSSIDLEHINVIIEASTPVLLPTTTDFGHFCHDSTASAPNVHTITGQTVQHTSTPGFINNGITEEWPSGSGVFYDTGNIYTYQIFCAGVGNIYAGGSGNEHFLDIGIMCNGGALPNITFVDYQAGVFGPVTMTTTPPAYATNMANSTIEVSNSSAYDAVLRFKFDSDDLVDIANGAQDFIVRYKIQHPSLTWLEHTIQILLVHDPSNNSGPYFDPGA